MYNISVIMNMNNRAFFLVVLSVLFVLACSLFPARPTPAPDLLATLRASTPGTFVPPAPTSLHATQEPGMPTSVSGASDGPPGKIVFTCQVYKVQSANQICIINADGSGFRRLTTDNTRQHYYGSPSPDGRSIVYAAFREANVYEIHEMDLLNGNVKQLTNRIGVLNAPEISPDGTRIVFMHWIAATDRFEIWVMGRDGSDPHRMFNITGWDPTWSPDGTRILFASNRDGTNQLWSVNLDGSDLRQISDLPDLRGRSDWSSRGQIATYSGEAWAREVFLMQADGLNAHRISPPGGNSQGPTFSPDGEWLAFTAYYDYFNDIHGCEIYIMRTDGTDLRRLTNNSYCDYQPRWGP